MARDTARKSAPLSESAAEALPVADDALAFTIKEFCKRHRLSPAKYYAMQLEGTGPDTMMCGRKVLISIESAARWRRQRELAAIAERAYTADNSSEAEHRAPGVE